MDSKRKLTVRRTEPSDAQALQRIFEDEQVYAQTLQLPHPPVSLWQERLAKVPDHIFSFVALLDDELVGNASVSLEQRARRRHVAHLGIVVHSAHIGAGIGTRLMKEVVHFCDDWLGLLRIELTVFADNERAIALYRKFDFQIEGEARGYAMQNGRYADVLYMARVIDNKR